MPLENFKKTEDLSPPNQALAREFYEKELAKLNPLERQMLVNKKMKIVAEDNDDRVLLEGTNCIVRQKRSGDTTKFDLSCQNVHLVPASKQKSGKLLKKKVGSLMRWRLPESIEPEEE